ncbi:MAG: heavy metal translocating P-type ATPase, partial [Mailhella sp.]|nr:heavy metal translocating P-type ATPase [Mailhella sp.]
MNFTLIHRIRGRARLRAENAFGLRTANTLADGLYGIPGMEGVRVNPRVGSVLLLYSDESVFEAACQLLNCAEQVQESRLPAVPQPDDGRPSLFPFFRYMFLRPLLPFAVNVVNAFRASTPYLKRCLDSLAHGRLDVDALDGTAIAISLLRRDFRTVGLLTLLLGFG